MGCRATYVCQRCQGPLGKAGTSKAWNSAICRACRRQIIADRRYNDVSVLTGEPRIGRKARRLSRSIGQNEA